jgi:HPt (histidine-containing phosphotransfer) domain-containing protein
LCAAKQRQLDAERRKLAALLEKENEQQKPVPEPVSKTVVVEQKVAKTKVAERSLRPPEVRQEIDQLIAEGDALLVSVEETMISETELWFEDVERFAQRHLNQKQYLQLHESSPLDAAEQVQQYRARADDQPIPEEEFAVAERLVSVSAGLREIRQALRG